MALPKSVVLGLLLLRLAFFSTLAVTACITYLKYFVTTEGVDCILSREAANSSFMCLNEPMNKDQPALQADSHKSYLYAIGAGSSILAAMILLPVS